jgi:hypothetical protein
VAGKGGPEVAEGWMDFRGWWSTRGEQTLSFHAFMSLSFNKIYRSGLDAASVATSIGFTAAKLGTKLGVRSLTLRSSFTANGTLSSSL